MKIKAAMAALIRGGAADKGTPCCLPAPDLARAGGIAPSVRAPTRAQGGTWGD